MIDNPVSYLRVAASLLLVIGLIVATLWLMRRFGLAGAVARRPGTKRRLALVEALQLDQRHRLVLVRRDGHEHLLLLGGGGEAVVERDITPANAEGTS